MLNDKESNDGEKRENPAEGANGAPGRFNGQNVMLIYAGRFVGVMVATAIMVIGVTHFEAPLGKAASVVAAGLAGLVAYLLLTKVFWRE